MPIQEQPFQQNLPPLVFQLPPEAKAAVERAAVLTNLTVTDFAVNAVVTTANEVLQQTRTLTDRDRDLFLALLDEETEPNEALRDAFATHARLIAK
jgi:uncharacterized protein (DUF1778 family)